MAGRACICLSRARMNTNVFAVKNLTPRIYLEGNLPRICIVHIWKQTSPSIDTGAFFVALKSCAVEAVLECVCKRKKEKIKLVTDGLLRIIQMFRLHILF